MLNLRLGQRLCVAPLREVQGLLSSGIVPPFVEIRRIMGKKKNPPGTQAFVEQNQVPFKNVDSCEESVKDESAAVSVHPPFSIPISELIHEMRLRNGLRHHDARRYRDYCTRRLRRIRGKLHYKHGRGRYIQRPFPLDITDVRYLHLLLLAAERCWAFSFHIKTILESSQATRYRIPHLRHFGRRRLRKAILYAKQLLEVCQRHADKFSVLEAKAYRSLLSGTLATDQRQWAFAAEELLLAKQYYMQLERIAAGTQSRMAAVNAQLTAVETQLRTVSYYLARQGMDVKAFLRTEPEMLEDAVATEHPVSDTEEPTELLWRGVRVTVLQSLISSSEYRSIERSVEEHLTPCVARTLADGKEAPRPVVWTELLDTFSQVQKTVEKSSTLIRESLLDATEEGSAQRDQTQLFVLESMIRDWTKLLAIELHLCLFHVILKTYSCNGFPHDQGTQSASNLCNASAYAPSLVVALADVTLQLLGNLETDISGTWPPPSLEAAIRMVQPVLLERLALWTRSVRDVRAMALCLVLQASGKHRDSYVLMEHLVGRRREYHTQGDVDDFKFPDSPFWRHSAFARVAERLVNVDALLSRCLPLLELHASASLIVASPSAFSCESKTVAPSYSTQYTIGAVQELAAQLSRELPDVDVPSLEPVPMKPIFFDLASTYLEAPDLLSLCGEKRGEATTSGLVGRLTSWWRR